MIFKFLRENFRDFEIASLTFSHMRVEVMVLKSPKIPTNSKSVSTLLTNNFLLILFFAICYSSARHRYFLGSIISSSSWKTVRLFEKNLLWMCENRYKINIHKVWFIDSSVVKVIGSHEWVNSKNIESKIWKMPYNFPFRLDYRP